MLRAHLCLRDAGYGQGMVRGITRVIHLPLFVLQDGRARPCEGLGARHGGLVQQGRAKAGRRCRRREAAMHRGCHRPASHLGRAEGGADARPMGDDKLRRNITLTKRETHDMFSLTPLQAALVLEPEPSLIKLKR